MGSHTTLTNTVFYSEDLSGKKFYFCGYSLGHMGLADHTPSGQITGI